MQYREQEVGCLSGGRAALLALCCLLLAPGAGCTGAISGADESPDPKNGSGNPDDPNPGDNGNRPPPDRVEIPDVPKPPGASKECQFTAAALPPVRAWRLSANQYANTVRTQFGVEVNAADLPAEVVSNDGVVAFDTSWMEAKVNFARADAYEKTAETVATKLVAELPADLACVKQGQAPDACVDKFVEAFGVKAFRRPISADERARYRKFYRDSAQAFMPAPAAQMTLEAMLQSPAFLFRTEIGGTSKDGITVELAPHELASQLSYMIADEPPSAALLAVADKGELTDAARVKAIATELMQSPAAKAKLKRFFDLYLHLSTLSRNEVTKNTAKYPGWSDISGDSYQELQAFLDEVVWNAGGGLRGLLTAPYGFVNNDLAEFYGIPEATSGKDFVKADMPTPLRAGLLGKAGLLAALSHADSTSPVHRGLFFFQTLLCQPLPTPPPGAEQMGAMLRIPEVNDATERQHWEHAQRVARGCTGCHESFQPIGLGLENFDPIGAYRTEEHGKTIDPRVQVVGFDALDGSYDNAIAFAQAVAESDAGRACFARQFMTFTQGRTIDPEAQACELESLTATLDGEMGVKDLIVALAGQPSFRYRRLAD